MDRRMVVGKTVIWKTDVPTTTADTDVDALTLGGACPDDSALYLHRATLREPGSAEGRSWVEREFRSATAARWQPKTLPVKDKGILEVDIGSVGRELEYDLQNGRVTGVAVETNELRKYVVIEGSNLAYLPTCVLRLSLLMSAPNVPTIMGLVGKSNAAACPNIGNVGAKELLMLRAPMQQVWRNEALYFATFHMAYNPANWETFCRIEKKQPKVVEVKVYDAAGVDTGRKRMVMEWVPLDTPVKEYRKIVATADYSVLNGMLA
jgi:hypothetical protein